MPSKCAALRLRALRVAEKAQTYPKRLRWVAFAGSHFEDQLGRLTALNDSIISLLDMHQRKRLNDIQESTFLHVLQTNNKVEDLTRLVHSLGQLAASLPAQTIQTASQQSRTDAEAANRRHADLAQFKALILQLELGKQASKRIESLPATSTVEIADDQVRRDKPLDGDLKIIQTPDLPCGSQTRGPKRSRSAGTYNDQPVWVEWKGLEAYPHQLGTDHLIERVAKLALMLQPNNKPPEFRTPDCIGHFHEPEGRLGLVFSCRRNVDDDHNKNTTVPMSLHHILGSKPKPSLTMRTQLAKAITTSLWYLHSVNWIHRAIRSDNILFVSDKDMSKPLISGFDFARPATSGPTTDLGDSERQHELYRHPDVQFDVPRDGRHGYHQLHDVYSLGVILCEIGLWRRVDDFLEMGKDGLLRRPELKGVKQRLLSNGFDEQLSAETGNIFANAARQCLQCSGQGGFMKDDEANESFLEGVLDLLASIVV